MPFDQREYLRQYYQDHKDVIKKQQKNYLMRYFQQCLEHYGTTCYCCGEENPLFLTLGHPNNDGAQHRREVSGRDKGSGTKFYQYLVRNNFPTDYELRTECFNCNCGAARNKGICPHQEDS